jgi:hypothetical protein
MVLLLGVLAGVTTPHCKKLVLQNVMQGLRQALMNMIMNPWVS